MIRSRKIRLVIVCGAIAVCRDGAVSGQVTKTAVSTPPVSDGAPAIQGITPPGATIGKSTEWTVSGANLARVDEWRISGTGVKVVGVEASAATTKLKVEVDPKATPGYREVRAMGPTGISNLSLVRIDRLDQIPEVEPNDGLDKATPMHAGSAAWGVIKPQDIDTYRITARAGSRMTIEVEAQRVGTPIVPIVTLMTATGSALAQARESRGADHDARLAFTFPRDGDYLIQVRDDLYSGGDSANYRLRVEEAPFAIGMFPLGGPSGAKLDITVSGGLLTHPRTKTVTLPDRVGALVDPGAFDGPDGPVLPPMKLVVGEGPEIVETATDATGQSTTPIEPGTTVNGRISAPGEVDRFTVLGKKETPIAIRVRASEMGSWLDSVVTVRDQAGTLLAENDDAPNDTSQRNGFALNQVAGNPDSRLVVEPKADGPITIELADRYGDGGPAYAYRLEVGPARPDFGISMLFANPALNANTGRVPRRAVSPGSNGSINLKPGQTLQMNFLITTDGKTGPIEVRAEGLPPGVTAKSKTIRPTATGKTRNQRAQANADSLVLVVAPDAEPSLGELRIVAVARPENAPEIVRTAASAIAIDTPLPGNAPPRPVMRTLPSLPVRVIGASKSDAVATGSREITFGNISVPGALLQGGRIDLGLDLQPRAKAAREVVLEAKVSGGGLAAQTVLNDPSATEPDAPVGIVRIQATVDAKPGVQTVGITARTKGGPTVERTASVIVRPPIVVRVRDEPIVVTSGKTANLWVGVSREPGFEGPVEIKLDLPKGVKLTGKSIIPAGESSVELVLEGAEVSKEPFAVRVTGVARMPRGPVRVDSAIRPMIVSRTAENGE